MLSYDISPHCHSLSTLSLSSIERSCCILVFSIHAICLLAPKALETHLHLISILCLSCKHDLTCSSLHCICLCSSSCLLFHLLCLVCRLVCLCLLLLILLVPDGIGMESCLVSPHGPREEEGQGEEEQEEDRNFTNHLQQQTR